MALQIRVLWPPRTTDEPSKGAKAKQDLVDGHHSQLSHRAEGSASRRNLTASLVSIDENLQRRQKRHFYHFFILKGFVTYGAEFNEMIY